MKLLLILAVILAPAVALAGGYELVQQGASAAGVGHAGVARDDDPTAAWFNPAALADGGGLRFGIGASLAGSTLVATALDAAEDGPWEARTDNALSVPPYAYLSVSNADWAAGVSANLPFAGGVRWADDWVQRFDIVQSAPRFARVAGFFAYRLGPLRLAVGPHLDFGALRLRKATNHIESEGTAEILVRGVGGGVDASLLVVFSPHAQLGFSYKSRTVLRMSGEADFEVPPAFQSRFPDQTVSTSMTLPDRFALGVALHPKGIERLGLFAELGLTLWAVNQEMVLDFASESTKDTVITNAWRNSLALRGGLEIEAHRVVRLRVGGYVDGLSGAPPPAANLSPSSPDSTRLAVTAGGRITPVDGLAIDLFYEHVELLRRESESEDAPQAAYRGSANVVGLSVSVTVPVKAKAKAETPSEPS